jgi:2-polyprenyl-3-methyl-5-hydroxy-6-metoxy-1,4-benzoquinol methylase
MNNDELPIHVRRNRKAWDKWAINWAEAGKKSWVLDEPAWGIWGIPERELHLLPENLDGLEAVELGCGTAYVSTWLARKGARVTGIDNSEEQLSTARALQ